MLGVAHLGYTVGAGKHWEAEPPNLAMQEAGLGFFDPIGKEKATFSGGLHGFVIRLTGFRGRGDWIRTSGPLHPMQVRYQAAPLPDPSVE